MIFFNHKVGMIRNQNAVWRISRVGIYLLSFFPFVFYWSGIIGVVIGILFYAFSKELDWRRNGIFLSLCIGITTLFVKLFGTFFLFIGMSLHVGYIIWLCILFSIKTLKKGTDREGVSKKIFPKTCMRNPKVKTKIEAAAIIVSFLAWSVILMPRFVPGVEIEIRGNERVKEYLDRGLIAIRTNSSVYIGWRLLKEDPGDIAFNIYRCNSTGPPVKMNANPMIRTTDFIDTGPLNESDFCYWICPIVNGTELSPSKKTTVRNDFGKAYISIKLNGTHTFQKVGIADLDGDGSYDFVIKQPNVNIDPFNWEPSVGTYKIEAYLSNGTFLWRNDLGWDIEQGVWYSPYVVYDLDGDGKAEVAIKTGEGDHRDFTGRVQFGPEYLSIWNGMSGTEVSRIAWSNRMPQIYNWNSRNQIGVAYLDGCRPFLIVARGTYWFMRAEAFQYDENNLERLWLWENTQESGFNYVGQGAHFMHSADVDSDGCDEVILGSCVINNGGVGLWSTGLQHADHCYVGDIDPLHPGLEIYYGIEGIIDLLPEYKNAICLVDAASGSILWGLQETTYHIHNQGLVSDIDPTHYGMECYSGEADYPKRWLHAANGDLIATKTIDISLTPRAVYWDADPQRELLYEGRIYDYETGFTHFQGIDGYQVAWADILGDWREEIIVSVAGELRIYTTTIPAIDRRPCLMQDPIYRNDVAHISMGYSQPPTTSYCLDTDYDR